MKDKNNKNSTLTLTQNRVFMTDIIIMNNDKYYKLGNGEKLIFGLKISSLSDEYIVRKILTDKNISGNGYRLNLTGTDTDIPQGRYFYDVALMKNDGELVKVIGTTECWVEKSIVRSDSK